MHLARDEIVDYALRYVDKSEIADFAYDGDLFCFFERSTQAHADDKDGTSWKFAGYGICIGYVGSHCG